MKLFTFDHIVFSPEAITCRFRAVKKELSELNIDQNLDLNFGIFHDSRLDCPLAAQS